MCASNWTAVYHHSVCVPALLSVIMLDCVLIICRFGHCSVLLPSGHILVYGGFGYRDSAGAHGRLDSLILVRKEEEEVVVEEDGKWAFAVEDVTEEGHKPAGELKYVL